MDIEICVDYKGLTWLVHIESYLFIPGEHATIYSPGSPDDVDDIKGWVELYGKIGDILDISQSDIRLLYLADNKNEELFDEIMEHAGDIIYEKVLEDAYSDDY